MNAKKILFPTDFSHWSDAALEHAASLARDQDATLLIVHVEEPVAAYGGEMYYGIIEPDLDALKKMLSEIVPAIPGVRYEHRLVVGNPAEVIVDLANREGVDLIVMATHGRTGLKRMLLGSVAEVVVRRATCPVLTLKSEIPTAAKVPAG